MMTKTYSRTDVEDLVDSWQNGPSWEDVDARADFARARATLNEQQRLALHYRCQGYETKQTAKLMSLTTRHVRRLTEEAITRMTEKMNGN